MDPVPAASSPSPCPGPAPPLPLSTILILPPQVALTSSFRLRSFPFRSGFVSFRSHCALQVRSKMWAQPGPLRLHVSHGFSPFPSSPSFRFILVPISPCSVTLNGTFGRLAGLIDLVASLQICYSDPVDSSWARLLPLGTLFLTGFQSAGLHVPSTRSAHVIQRPLYPEDTSMPCAFPHMPVFPYRNCEAFTSNPKILIPLYFKICRPFTWRARAWIAIHAG